MRSFWPACCFPTAECMRINRLNSLILPLLMLATALVYWKTLGQDFVAWDDDINIYSNLHIRSLDGASLAWMFTDTQEALRFKPLSWFCWALIYSWKGLNPFGFHLANLLLHCFNAVLLFALLKFFFCGPEGTTPESSPHRMILCAWGALLWAIHPLRAER